MVSSRRFLAPLAILLAAVSVSALSARTTEASRGVNTVAAGAAFTYTGIISTGQSLNEALHGTPATSTSQPYNNVQLWDSSATYDTTNPNATTLSLVPLVAVLRGNVTGVNTDPYPLNVLGETSDVRMANEFSAIALENGLGDYRVSVSNVGIAGAGLSVIQKGGTGNAYAASLYEAQAIKRLVAARGGTFGIGAVVLIHGENDSTNAAYQTGIATLQSNYQTDLQAITGQVRPIPLLITQQHSYPLSTTTDIGSNEQYLASYNSAPGGVLLIGGTYTYPYYSDQVHRTEPGYTQVGDLLAKYLWLVEQWQTGRASWPQPMQPIYASITRSSNTITVPIHVPVGPIVIDTTVYNPHQSGTYAAAWSGAHGWEAWTGGVGGTAVTINSVSVTSNPSGSNVTATVTIACATQPDTIAYAQTPDSTTGGAGTPNGRGGQFRDSDTWRSILGGEVVPNWLVQFYKTGL